MVAFLKTLKTPAVFKTALDDPEQASGAGREARESRCDRKSRHVGGRQGAGALEAEELDRLLLQHLPQRSERDVQDLGGVDAEMGAAAQQGAGRRGIRHPPRQGHHRRRLADGDRREPRRCRSICTISPTARRSRSTPPARKRKRRSSAARSSPAASSANSTSPAPTATAKSANHWIRGQWLGEPKGQYDHFPTWRTSLLAIWDIRQRFQWCQVNIRADELPPDAKEYGDLELYLAVAERRAEAERAGDQALTVIRAASGPMHHAPAGSRARSP